MKYFITILVSLALILGSIFYLAIYKPIAMLEVQNEQLMDDLHTARERYLNAEAERDLCVEMLQDNGVNFRGF